MSIAFTNALYGRLLGDEPTAALFSPEAEIRSMIAVEAALARAQAKLGIVPEEAAGAISDGLANVVVDPAELAGGTQGSGVPVPALVLALRERLPADAGHWLHWRAHV